MSTERKNFIMRDEGFACLVCGEKNPELGKGCRNHCVKCLSCLHVDVIPGDRAETCKGIMDPVNIEFDGAKGWIIIHQCRKCGKIVKNKSAEDDNKELITRLMNIDPEKSYEKNIRKNSKRSKK